MSFEVSSSVAGKSSICFSGSWALEEEDAAEEVDECEAFFSVFAPPSFPSSREPVRVTDDVGLRFIQKMGDGERR